MALRGSKVDFLSEDLSLGLNPRKVVAEVERSQMVGEGRSSQSWMASGIMPLGILGWWLEVGLWWCLLEATDSTTDLGNG